MKTNLKRIRIELLGCTQSEMAEGLKVTVGAYSNYETGRRPFSPELAERLIEFALQKHRVELEFNDIYKVTGQPEKPKRGAPKRKISPEKVLREVQKILSSLHK